MKLTINHNLSCEVDHRKCDCRREPAHCHIVKGHSRVAQVWLNPVRIESGHSLDRNEVKEVERFVESHRDTFQRTYEYNRECGADY